MRINTEIFHVGPSESLINVNLTLSSPYYILLYTVFQELFADYALQKFPFRDKHVSVAEDVPQLGKYLTSKFLFLGLISSTAQNLVWWYTSLIPTTQRCRLEDQEFSVILDYILSSRDSYTEKSMAVTILTSSLDTVYIGTSSLRFYNLVCGGGVCL